MVPDTLMLFFLIIGLFMIQGNYGEALKACLANNPHILSRKKIAIIRFPNTNYSCQYRNIVVS